jgi:signal transduction histidine kinase
MKNIEIKRRFAAVLPEVMVDYFQIQQVFFNIIVNAEYFMIKAHNRGVLTVTTEILGNFIKISFTDDGPGIEEKYLSDIFTPLFTTKQIGKGTGLGLSICHGIIAEHNGRLYAESQVGKGATFIIELPIKH